MNAKERATLVSNLIIYLISFSYAYESCLLSVALKFKTIIVSALLFSLKFSLSSFWLHILMMWAIFVSTLWATFKITKSDTARQNKANLESKSFRSSAFYLSKSTEENNPSVSITKIP